MYSVMAAFCLASVMLCVGMLIRGKVKAIQKMLIPANIIAGVVGIILINVLFASGVNFYGVSTDDFTSIVDVFFVLSFISIGLTGTNKKDEPKQARAAADTDETEAGGKKKKKKKEKGSGVMRGGFGMALIWCALFSLTAVVGAGLLYIIGPIFGMDPMYGFMIPFAFCQGPGQAHTFGAIFESYGYTNAETVAVTYAAVGFLVAFLVGVPLARYGLRKGLGKYKSDINETVQRGFYYPEEQRESLGKATFQSANIETVAVHFAIIGVTYLLAVGLAYLCSFIPGIGSTFAAMLFMWGELAAIIVKSILKKLKIDYIINNHFMSRITSFLTDYLIVCAFMSISFRAIGIWIVPILILAAAASAVTYLYCVYFGARLGSDHDFERTLGLYGSCTGTIPSGVSLLRIVDQRLQTPTGMELGTMNALLIIDSFAVIFLEICGLGYISVPICLILLIVTVVVYLVLGKLSGNWGKPTYSLSKGRLTANGEEETDGVLVGTFQQPDDVLDEVMSKMRV